MDLNLYLWLSQGCRSVLPKVMTYTTFIMLITWPVSFASSFEYSLQRVTFFSIKKDIVCSKDMQWFHTLNTIFECKVSYFKIWTFWIYLKSAQRYMSMSQEVELKSLDVGLEPDLQVYSQYWISKSCREKWETGVLSWVAKGKVLSRL